MVDDVRELYVSKVISSEIPNAEDKVISVELICKNIHTAPRLCVDIFFFSLVDSSGKHHRANLTESTIMAARTPIRDIIHGMLVFTIPKAQNATQLIYNEPRGSSFLIDLSSAKIPADTPPRGEWRLGRNMGLEVSDSRIKVKIYNETLTKDQYILDISIRNEGHMLVNYNALYMYLKDSTGLVFGPALDAEVDPKILSGTLLPGHQVRGKIAFNVGNQVGPFMFIYDDITMSYLTTGKFVPVSSPIKGLVTGKDSVSISKHNAYWESSSRTFKILGEISNGSEQPITGIIVHAVLKDRDSKTISTIDQNVRNFLSAAPTKLSSNARVPFTIEFNLPSVAKESIGSYELSLSYTYSDAYVAALQVNSAKLLQLSKSTPLSKYVFWQINGELENVGNVRSTHTQVMASLYDSNGLLVGVGGFSTLDAQPKELNPGQKRQFSLEIPVPVATKPSSFYLYVQSDQFVISEPKPSEIIKYGENGSEAHQNNNSMLVSSKQRDNLLQIVIKNVSNDISVYGIELKVNETSMHILKTKLRWNVSEVKENGVLLSTINNPINAGQKAKFLFNVNDEVSRIFYKVLSNEGKVLLEDHIEPFIVRFGSIR